MTGLDKILAEIHREADNEAHNTVEKAKAKAEQIQKEAKAESDAIVERISESAAQETAEIIRSRDSVLVLQSRQRTLAAKQELLSETMQKAKEELLDLPDNEYFDLLVTMAQKAVRPGEGVLYLNNRDMARIPADFATTLLAALPNGCVLKVSDDTRSLNGGFVLAYGDIEENCSFDAIFDARIDEFKDIACSVLFEN